MIVKRYRSVFESDMKLSDDGNYVRYEDYKHLSDYCDHLVEFSKLPCLPADLKNLREANSYFATTNMALAKEIEALKKQLNELK